MLLFIEQRHIDMAKGWSANPSMCPIAQAVNELMGLKDVFQDADGWHTNATGTRVDVRRTDEATVIRYVPSLAAKNFMARFDNGDKVDPCVLELYQDPIHLPLIRWYGYGDSVDLSKVPAQD